jgi:[CysO sulfur-carrier protein]-S-L-cysteine hydrolase
MITLTLPRGISQQMASELQRAGRREIGGILLAEHVGTNRFVVRDITVHRIGTFASFVRRIEEALGHLRWFFNSTQHEYSRFNYIGEWHSHPSFEPVPSPRDDCSMSDIVLDPSVGANFVVLLVVKLDNCGSLAGSLHTYLPDGSKHRSELAFESIRSTCNMTGRTQ